MLEYLTTWGVTKAAGFSSYLLLFVSVILGAFAHSKQVSIKQRAKLIIAHQWFGWFGFLFSLIHGVVLWIDDFQPFRVVELLVPFYAEYKPIATGIGILAFYMFLAVMLSSDGIKKLGIKAWRSIHYLAFPAFVLSFIHGLTAGSDSGQSMVKGMYVLTALLFVLFILLRMKKKIPDKQAESQ